MAEESFESWLSEMLQNNLILVVFWASHTFSMTEENVDFWLSETLQNDVILVF